ncbi:hypothetical protein TNCV_1071721, partial [Trichonephila clavipes]
MFKEEHETSMKEQKCLPERCKRTNGEQVQTHSADEYAVAQSVDVIKIK